MNISFLPGQLLPKRLRFRASSIRSGLALLAAIAMAHAAETSSVHAEESLTLTAPSWLNETIRSQESDVVDQQPQIQKQAPRSDESVSSVGEMIAVRPEKKTTATRSSIAALINESAAAGSVAAKAVSAKRNIYGESVVGEPELPVPMSAPVARPHDNRQTLFTGDRTLPPLRAPTTGTAHLEDVVLPKGFLGQESEQAIQLPESGIERGLAWDWQMRFWAAPNTFSHPLYFEDRMLERHGHQKYPAIQPLISGTRFTLQWMRLPYLSAIHPPSECLYSLGYFRAGSCVSKFRQRAPYSRRALAAQALSTGAGIAVLP